MAQGRTVIVSALQFACSDDVSKNVDTVERLVRAAHKDGANIILTQLFPLPGICWDQCFPEAARAMVLQGAEILFYPTAIGSKPQDDGLDSRDHWRKVMQGHAGANLVPVVASNRMGKEIIQTEHGKSEITFYGNSFMAGSTGKIVATADDKEATVLVASINVGSKRSPT